VTPPKKATEAAPARPAVTAMTRGRKPWIKKSPVDVVLEQITKQEEKVNDMRTELVREERLLAKMQKAKTAFEAD
jgi:hypothetical protein